MKPAYLVDSDWVIHYLNGQPTVVAKLQELQQHGIAISVISFAELYEGVYYSRDPDGKERDLNDFIRGLSVIGIDEGICKVFGRVRGQLRAKKKTVADFDLRIGSSALKVLRSNRSLSHHDGDLIHLHDGFGELIRQTAEGCSPPQDYRRPLNWACCSCCRVRRMVSC